VEAVCTSRSVAPANKIERGKHRQDNIDKPSQNTREDEQTDVHPPTTREATKKLVRKDKAKTGSRERRNLQASKKFGAKASEEADQKIREQKKEEGCERRY